MSDVELVSHAIALLEAWRANQVGPELAWAEVQRLNAAYPERHVQLVWERERYVNKVHYDLLIERGPGVLAISYCGDDDTPWPTRGIQRVEECLVARVDGQPLDIGTAMASLDYAWHTLHVGRHLIDMSLVEHEQRRRGIEVDDDDVAAELDEFRAKRGLFTAASAERWMAEHGVSHGQLDHHLRQQAGLRALRRAITGGDAACAAHFAAHRADFDRVQVARIGAATSDGAHALLAELTPSRFLVEAQRAFLDGAAPGDVFATWRRAALDRDVAEVVFATEPGCVVPRALPSGDRFEVVQVLRHVPAVLDAATRAEIAELLFRRWLEARRATARVEWFWGADEAADVPALQL